jgi:hypothetical protein
MCSISGVRRGQLRDVGRVDHDLPTVGHHRLELVEALGRRPHVVVAAGAVRQDEQDASAGQVQLGQTDPTNC